MNLRTLLLAIGALAGGYGLYALGRKSAAAQTTPTWGGGTPQFDPFGSGSTNYSPAPNPYQGQGPTGYYAGGGPQGSYF